jgi:uncharacterized LabA/DUF88 family protein
MSTQLHAIENKRKTIVYIDGFNLYFAMRDKGWSNYMWLDLIKFSQQLLNDTQELVHVKYFTSRIKNDPEKQKRQNLYLEALTTLNADILKVYEGQYQSNTFSCPSCRGELWDDQEKQTDVNIAVHMLLDAFSKNKVDDLILITADSDQCASVKAVRVLGKHILVALPPGRGDYVELKKHGNSHIEITAKKFKGCRLPDSIPINDKFTIKCPTKWLE